MGGLPFRAKHSWSAAALAMALLPLPLIALDPLPAWAEQQIAEITVATFLTDPPEILRENPKGGARLIVEVRDLALSDPTTLPSILALLPEASEAQKAAIGAGLAQAEKVARRTRPAYANEIQQAVVQTNDRELILAYDAGIATSIGELRAPDGALTPEANGASAGTVVGPTTTTALTQTVEPTILVVPAIGVPPPAIGVPPPAIGVPPSATASTPAGVSPFVASTAAVASLAAIVPSPVVSAPIAALTEAVEPTIPVIAPIVPPPVSLSTPSPLVVPTPFVVPSSMLAVEPQTSNISKSMSPSH